jgi:hypothetical protein
VYEILSVIDVTEKHCIVCSDMRIGSNELVWIGEEVVSLPF